MCFMHIRQLKGISNAEEIHMICAVIDYSTSGGNSSSCSSSNKQNKRDVYNIEI